MVSNLLKKQYCLCYFDDKDKEAVVSSYKLNTNVICVKKEEEDMWYWDKLLSEERIGMPIDPRT